MINQFFRVDFRTLHFLQTMRNSSLDKWTQTQAIYHDKQTEARSSNFESLFFFKVKYVGKKDLSKQLNKKYGQNNWIVTFYE